MRERWMVSLMLLTLTVSLVASDLASVLAQLVRGQADERALSVLQSAVKQDPSAPAWWVWLGYAHSLRGEWAQAAQAYCRAQQLGARSSFAWFPPSLPPHLVARTRQLAFPDNCGGNCLAIADGFC